MESGTFQVECPICGQQAASAWIRQEPWGVVRCLRCGLGITWPRPDPAILGGIYSSRDYYVSRHMDDGVQSEAAYRAQQLLEGRRGRLRRVLDFGAGEGHLVAAFRALGVEADGVESSEAGRREARRRYGIDTWAELPADPARDRDLIILCHSLEHVLDPLGVLRTLRGHLAADGELLIEVPNIASFEMLRPARRRVILDLPAHLFHFTPKTLESLLAAAGFVVTQIRLTNPAWLEWLFALRASVRRVASGRGTKADEDRGGNVEMVDQHLRGVRRHWRAVLLPWIRCASPGWAFQVMASPRRSITHSE
jgi:SAM-dependent methyltransferase